MSDEKDNGQASDLTTPLAVQDLITDEAGDIFSEYVSVSITNDGHDTTLSATTVQGDPVVYTATFHGITAESLQTLISQSGLDTDLG